MIRPGVRGGVDGRGGRSIGVYQEIEKRLSVRHLSLTDDNFIAWLVTTDDDAGI